MWPHVDQDMVCLSILFFVVMKKQYGSKFQTWVANPNSTNRFPMFLYFPFFEFEFPFRFSTFDSQWLTFFDSPRTIFDYWFWVIGFQCAVLERFNCHVSIFCPLLRILGLKLSMLQFRFPAFRFFVSVFKFRMSDVRFSISTTQFLLIFLEICQSCVETNLKQICDV